MYLIEVEISRVESTLGNLLTDFEKNPRCYEGFLYIRNSCGIYWMVLEESLGGWAWNQVKRNTCLCENKFAEGGDNTMQEACAANLSWWSWLVGIGVRWCHLDFLVICRLSCTWRFFIFYCRVSHFIGHFKLWFKIQLIRFNAPETVCAIKKQ